MKTKSDLNTINAGIATVILAAGKGTRMKSDLAKVLHLVCGKPMLFYSVEAAREIGSYKIVAVIGHQAEKVKRTMKDDSLLYVLQKEQLGTAHAVMQTESMLKDFEGSILILCGDVPLLRPSTVRALIEFHRESLADITVLTTVPSDPSGYGRIIKDGRNRVTKITEDRDASRQEKLIREINTGIYCVESDFLYKALAMIKAHNSQREYYLTDIFEIAAKEGRESRSFLLHDPLEAMGINNAEQLKEAEKIMKSRLLC